MSSFHWYSKSVRAHVLQRHLPRRRLRADKRHRSKGKPEDEGQSEDEDQLPLIRQRAGNSMCPNAVDPLQRYEEALLQYTKKSHPMPPAQVAMWVIKACLVRGQSTCS